MNIQKVLFAALVFSIVRCASVPAPSAQENPTSQEDTAFKTAAIEPAAARPLFAQAEKAYKARKLKPAADAYRAIKARFPNSLASQLASFRLGMVFYQTANYAPASQELSAFLGANPPSELVFDATYHYAAAEYQQTHFDKALEALRRLTPEALRKEGPKRSEVVYQLAAQAASSLGNHGATIVYHALQLQLPVEEFRRKPIEASISNHLVQIGSATELNSLLGVVSEPGTRSKIGERLAALSFAGTPATSQNPSPALSVNSGSADRSHLGVVLPLSGSLAPYGRKALDGILLAAGAFKDDGLDIELFVEDSGSNPATAAQAVEKLVSEHGVIAILGPISWKESIAVADKSQELGVLNLSLSGKEGISERGAYLFQNALTPRVQMENLVRHCIERKGLRRFAIIAPENGYGEDMATQFIAVANKLGGRIVGFETYPSDARDFQDAVQKITGLSDLRYRRAELAKLNAFIKEQQAKTKRPSKARLPPIVDFDAVFIPDGPKVAAQIAASLAYFDVTGIPLLGTSEWNNDQLYKRGGRLVEGALFPAGLQLGAGNTQQAEFIRQYSEAYGVSPDLLAAQAYEALELVVKAASESSGTRNGAVNTLTALRGFESSLGQVSIDSGRIALRALPILALAPGGAFIQQ